MHIVQIAPEIAPGSGVAGVAWALEQEFAERGVRVERFTLVQARRGRARKPLPGNRLGRHLRAAWTVVWFSTVGTRRARTFLAARPDAVSICHNDALVGDIYVNHGLLQPAMKARGHYGWRMLRNPVHVFTVMRDRRRYRTRTHRAVVALTRREAGLLTRTYGRVAPPITVIPNGVDLERFRPPTTTERRAARAAAGLPAKGLVAVFVGHEFDRKGLSIAIAALQTAHDATLYVIGGSPEAIRSAQSSVLEQGVGHRVIFAGTTSDPAPLLRAADVFVLPSAYEANALVVLEALATGLPVISTRVGFAPDLVIDGENGFLVGREAEEVGERLRDLGGSGLRARSAHARRTAEKYSWGAAADRYLALAESVRASRPTAGDSAGSSTPRILHAIRSDGFAGVEQFVLRLALTQARAGHHVHVIGGDPSQMRDPLTAAGVAFTPAARTAQVARAVRRLHRHTDVVNTHMTAADIGAFLALAGIRDRPAVISTRHFAKPRGRVGPIRIDALIASTIDAEISISDAVAARIAAPSTVVRSGVEPGPVADPALRGRTVLIAQRLEPEKSTDRGIRAFAASGLADIGWVLEIAGRGSERDRLAQLTEDLGIGAAVRFLGFRADLPELMALAGLLLAPCPNEGLGLTVVEAMAVALPVIAADAGGHVELLAGLDERALFPSDDTAAAAERLRSLATDPAARERLGTLERERQSSLLTPAHQLEGTSAVYRDTIARRGTRGRRG